MWECGTHERGEGGRASLIDKRIRETAARTDRQVFPNAECRTPAASKECEHNVEKSARVPT